MTQEALKIALDALETELSIDWTNNDEFNASAEKMYAAIAAIKETLAQPEQEPVADDFFKMIADRNPKPFSPQRTWVGLTGEEILDLFDINNVYGSKWIEFVRCVEAKLKEKNT